MEEIMEHKMETGVIWVLPIIVGPFDYRLYFRDTKMGT